jgi:hypothetical protein
VLPSDGSQTQAKGFQSLIYFYHVEYLDVYPPSNLSSPYPVYRRPPCVVHSFYKPAFFKKSNVAW